MTTNTSTNDSILYNPNPLPKRMRIVSILADWLVTHLYIALIATILLVVISLYQRFSNHLVAESLVHILIWVLMIVPIIIFMTFMDIHFNASLGKQLINIEVVYRKKTFGSCLIRNSLKWLPVGIMINGVVHFLYQGWNSKAVILIILGVITLLIIISSAFLRSDQRHIIDLMVKSQVIGKNTH